MGVRGRCLFFGLWSKSQDLYVQDKTEEKWLWVWDRSETFKRGPEYYNIEHKTVLCLDNQTQFKVLEVYNVFDPFVSQANS